MHVGKYTTKTIQHISTDIFKERDNSIIVLYYQLRLFQARKEITYNFNQSSRYYVL